MLKNSIKMLFFGQKVYPNYRIAGRYKINENTSVKFAGLQIYQFIHSLTNNTTASPIDTWRISTNHLQPQASTQVSIGVFKTTNNQAIELGLEGFYKRQENLVDFKTGAQLFMNQFIETEVLQGKGEGLWDRIFIAEKQEKALAGWATPILVL